MRVEQINEVVQLTMNPRMDPHIPIQVQMSNKFLLPNREEPDAEQYGCEI